MNLSYTVWLSVYLISRISIVFTQQTDFKKEALEECLKSTIFSLNDN